MGDILRDVFTEYDGELPPYTLINEIEASTREIFASNPSQNFFHVWRRQSELCRYRYHLRDVLDAAASERLE